MACDAYILKAYLSQVSDSIHVHSAGIVIVYAFQCTLIGGISMNKKKMSQKKRIETITKQAYWYTIVNIGCSLYKNINA